MRQSDQAVNGWWGLRVGRGFLRLSVTLVLWSLLAGAQAASLHIKIATLAPQGTSYHLALERLAQQWESASKGRVRVTVYPGGIQGGEEAMVQRMNLNSLQAALITANGLDKIVPEVQGLQSIPMLFDSLEEVEYINRKLAPKIDKLLADQGYVALFWGDSGWVQFFSRKPFRRPDELRQFKLFTWAGQPETERLYRKVGLQPVPMEPGEILTGLKTGYIDAVAMPPFAANANQIYREAPYMLDLKWAPLVGAFVINSKTWNKLSPELQQKFRQIAEQTGKIIKALGRKESEQAIEVMQKKWNLKVIEVPPALAEEWRREAEKVYPDIRGRLVPADMFDEVLRLLKEYRVSKAKGAG